MSVLYHHLIVPLDGSPESEAIFPVLEGLTAREGRTVTLLHVVETRAPARVHGAPHLRGRAEAEAYLASLQRRWSGLAGVVAIHVVDAGDRSLVQAVVQAIKWLQADMVALCSHGPSDLPKALVGSLAQQIAHVCRLPVLALRVRQLPLSCQNPRSILILVDPERPEVPWLDLVRQQWETWCQPIHCLSVVPTMATVHGNDVSVASFLPNATRELLDLEAEATYRWLSDLAQEANRSGISLTVTLRRGNELDLLRGEVQALNCPLVVLSTHAPAAFQALLQGSLTARFFATSTVPVLLLPLSSPP
ncbi:MAG: universal stress protein [Chloroflexi bacterium]|nr:universal stress protein [Chloroflexota bacterium]